MSVTIHIPPPTAHSRRYRYGYIVDCDGAWVRVRPFPPAVVLTMSGHIGAANSDRVRVTMNRFISDRCPVVVDVSGVGFLAARGYLALLGVRQRCYESGVQWALVGGAALWPHLRDAAIPVSHSMSGALRDIEIASHANRRPARITPPATVRC